MPVLFFLNLDSLRLALASGVVPLGVSRVTTRAGFDDDGHLWLELGEPLTRESLAGLSRLCVIALGGTAVLLNPVRCCAELLPLRRVNSATLPPGPVLFEVSDRLLAGFVASVRRLCGVPVGVRLLPEP